MARPAVRSASNWLRLLPAHVPPTAKCLVREQARETDERIYAPYRINIEAVNPDTRHWSQIDKPHRRYFHVSCLEAIGVDIAKFARLRSEYAVSHRRMGAICTESQEFHPAIYDLVTQKGKAFDAAKYATFEKPHEDWRESLKGHVMFSSIHDVSGSTLERPKTSDYIEGEPTERTLSHVVLHVMEAEHLANAPAEIKIGVLEVYGGVPTSLTKAALAVEDEGDSVDSGKDSADSAEASAQVDEAESIPQAEDVRQAEKDKGGQGEEEPKRATE